MPTPPLANLADLDLQAQGHGEGLAAQIARIGPLIGADKLGCTLGRATRQEGLALSLPHRAGGPA